MSNCQPTDTRRTSQFSLEIENSDSSSISYLQKLEMVEVEIQTTDDTILDWPQSLPPIDGVIICYDSSIKSSYQPVEGLLSG